VTIDTALVIGLSVVTAIYLLAGIHLYRAKRRLGALDLAMCKWRQRRAEEDAAYHRDYMRDAQKLAECQRETEEMNTWLRAQIELLRAKKEQANSGHGILWTASDGASWRC